MRNLKKQSRAVANEKIEERGGEMTLMIERSEDEART